MDDWWNSEEEDLRLRKKAETESFRRGFVWGMTAMLLFVTVFAFCVRHTSFGDWLARAGGAGPAKIAVTGKQIQTKMEILADLIDEKYYKDVDSEKFAEGMYRGLVSGLEDPYSMYYTAEAFENTIAFTAGDYYGIGAVLKQDGKQIRIRQVYEGSPAEKAGLLAEDILLEVEGQPAEKKTATHLTNLLKGEEGSVVHIKVQRETAGVQGELLEFEIERGYVEVPTIEYRMLEHKAALLKILEFTEKTPEQFCKAIADLESQGMEALIIDLRDNPGGVLDGVCDVLDQILPEGLLVYTEDKAGNRKEYTSSKDSFLDLPLAVLINEKSASASEVFAAAIQDFEYGTLIGTTTFGKGIVQQFHSLADGSAVKLTVSRYFTPSGENIHEVGITPDIELEYEYSGSEEEKYDPMLDNQVQKALEVVSP